ICFVFGTKAALFGVRFGGITPKKSPRPPLATCSVAVHNGWKLPSRFFHDGPPLDSNNPPGDSPHALPRPFDIRARLRPRILVLGNCRRSSGERGPEE